ncbi:SOS response-associated peptidase [Arenibacter lacus]|uniref:SOS response-associated peptidase n=2 Tax=Arenibacter TaxID=178469 RepID=UPI000A36A1B3|nr:SOS response-associated peptidase family protein [Arenibacter lacus]
MVIKQNHKCYPSPKRTMYYKISNTASSTTLNETFHTLFKYPHLYQKQLMINGIEEVTIPIIAMEERNYMVPAMWGMLPENYEDEWSVFQETFNSLNIAVPSLDNLSWCTEALIQRRCLIPVTGFYTSYLIDGELYPYFFHKKSNLPFCLTGIYNRTLDGFLTCTVLTTTAREELKQVHNLNGTVPLMLPRDQHQRWLDPHLKDNILASLLEATPDFNLVGHPISRELFKNQISYTSMLAPVYYKAAPTTIILTKNKELILP